MISKCQNKDEKWREDVFCLQISYFLCTWLKCIKLRYKYYHILEKYCICPINWGLRSGGRFLSFLIFGKFLKHWGIFEHFVKTSYWNLYVTWFLADISKLVFLICGWIIGLNKLKAVSNYGTRGTAQATHNFVLALSFSEQFVSTVNILIRLPAILDKNWTKASFHLDCL